MNFDCVSGSERKLIAKMQEAIKRSTTHLRDL